MGDATKLIILLLWDPFLKVIEGGLREEIDL